jgi:NAD(P)-dependent dehydrogenase (short-subunit alcohol dehydrogenase family)
LVAWEFRGRDAAARLGARFVQLDVTDDASVTAAAKAIEADGGSTCWSITPASSRARPMADSSRPPR